MAPVSLMEKQASKTLTAVIIDTDGDMVASPFPTKELDQLSFMQEAVGGYIEPVPYFNMFDHDGKAHICVAFCDEDGKRKGVPVNREATKRWDRCLEGQGVARNPDFLVGRVLVLYGDPKLLSEL